MFCVLAAAFIIGGASAAIQREPDTCTVDSCPDAVWDLLLQAEACCVEHCENMNTEPTSHLKFPTINSQKIKQSDLLSSTDQW